MPHPMDETATLRLGDVIHTKDERLTVESIMDGRVNVKEGGFVWPSEILDVEPAARPTAGTQPVPVKPIDVSYRKTYPPEWPRVSDESVMPNSDEAKRQRARFIEARAAMLHPRVLLHDHAPPAHTTYTTTGTSGTADVSVADPSCGTVSIGTGGTLAPPSDYENHEAHIEAARVLEEEWARYRMWYYGGYVPWASAVGAKPKPDTRCPRVDADTGIRCMHEAGTPHAHETPAGKPIFSEHSGPKLGEYRATGFGITLDLPIPPGPAEKLLIRAEAALQKNPHNRRNWPKGDVDGTMGLTFAPASSAAAKRRGAGSHLAALHQDTLNRPFYRGKRVRA